MPGEKTLRWREFHRERARRAARGADNPGLTTFGAVPTPQPIVTFIPNRTALVYSLVQNDGSLVSSYDPTTIQTTAPKKSAAERALPARRQPSTATSSARRRTQAAPRANAPRPTQPRSKTTQPTPRANAPSQEDLLRRFCDAATPRSDEELLRRFREREAAEYARPSFQESRIQIQVDTPRPESTFRVAQVKTLPILAGLGLVLVLSLAHRVVAATHPRWKDLVGVVTEQTPPVPSELGRGVVGRGALVALVDGARGLGDGLRGAACARPGHVRGLGDGLRGAGWRPFGRAWTGIGRACGRIRGCRGGIRGCGRRAGLARADTVGL
ncbi:hypothetical protein C8F04DRAFT_1177978 [Mycena alexandri]|uniref:Uncharacterized protein n=1 Tax=Mycena alexandri TaxID=1745969 RepID=A0AAD6T5L8_9AGAR|nr:hypothetical protein C8F04DRAFT_1177978 [Mycena alexandri]